MEQSKTYRVNPDLSIKRGKWYVAVRCKGCQDDIILFDDQSEGQGPIPRTLAGGKLSIPCRCGHDDFYEEELLFKTKARFSRRSLKDERVKPAAGPRQPFLPRYKSSLITFGPLMIERRPAAGSIISRVMAGWTFCELEAARILALILQADTDASVAVYLTLQNARARQDVMFAAAEASLGEGDLKLMKALLALKSTVEKDRNALAHGVFGICEKIQQGLVWCETSAFIKFQREAALKGATPEIRERLYRKCAVFDLPDLERIAQEIEFIHVQLTFFCGYLQIPNGHPFRVERFAQLCSEPKISQILANT